MTGCLIVLGGMMTSLELKVDKRQALGKKTRFLRRQGLTPAHLFGHNIKSQALQCDTTQLEEIISRAGTTRIIDLHISDEKQPKKVFIREVQRNPVKDYLYHVDFYQIKMKEKMKADIPVVIVGEAPALKGKGHILEHISDHITVECFPDKLPPNIEVDISSLEEVNQAIHVGELNLGSDVAILTDSDKIVVKISEVAAARLEEEAEVAEEEEAEAVEGEEAEVETVEAPAEEKAEE
jgi:large subunit ribosomal protein L25